MRRRYRKNLCEGTFGSIRESCQPNTRERRGVPYGVGTRSEGSLQVHDVRRSRIEE